MTSFFNASATADLAYIIRPLRDHQDLPTVAYDAEQDVINYYTRRYPAAVDYSNNFYVGQGFNLGNGMYIALNGFNPDASAVSDAKLVDALKRTIADVINWRLSKYGENSLILTQVNSKAAGTKQFRHDVFSPFPPGNWAYRLRRWTLLAPLYTI